MQIKLVVVDSIEQHFPLVLFITMFKVVLAFATVDNFHDLTIQIKSVEQPFPTGLFVVLFKEVQPLRLWIKSSSLTTQMPIKSSLVGLSSVCSPYFSVENQYENNFGFFF